MSRPRILFVVVFALVGATLSVSLLMHHHGVGAGGGLVGMICGADTESGCSAVEASGYSAVWGFPLAGLGVFFYAALALLFVLLLVAETEVRKVGRMLGFWIVTAGLAVDLILLAVQMFVVGQFCSVCLMTYGCTAIMLLLIRRPGGRLTGGSLKAVIGSREGRIAVAGLSQGLLVLAAAVVMTNLALSNADVRKLEGRLIEEAVAEYNASPARTIPADGAPAMGDPKAPIRVVIFSDFLCPWCRETAKFFQGHMPAWRDRVHLVYLNYPLDKLCNTYQGTSVHPGSCWSALGGLCAQEQGRFWEFHDRLFANQPKNPSGQDIMKIAYGAGIDTSLMKSCMISVEMRRKVRLQINEAHSLGITGTPQIFVNGKLVPKLAALAGILQSEARRLGVQPLEGMDD